MIHPDNPLLETTVTQIEQIAPHVFIIRIPKLFSFVPGQVIAAGLTANDPEPRLYSIASGLQEKYISILFQRIDDGLLTPHLSELNPGDTIYVSKPFGTFYGKAGKAWWIATGTGIAPFYSMFKSGLSNDKKLIHGGKYRHSFYFEKEFSATLKDNYIRCCSREDVSGAKRGRVTRYLPSLSETPTNIKYYLCGSAEMIVEVRDLLLDRGVPFTNIHAEIYF